MPSRELAEELAIEIDAMRQTISRIEQMAGAWQKGAPSETEVVAIAAYVANLYAGLERVLIRIAKSAGVPLPAGPAWHRELLEIFRPGGAAALPELLPLELEKELGRYLTFRHVFVHGYAIRLDWTKLRPAADTAPRVFGSILQTLEAWLSES